MSNLRFVIIFYSRLISNITVSDEYYKLVTELDFKKEDIEKLIIYGFESTFLQYEHRKKMLEEVTPEIKRILYSE